MQYLLALPQHQRPSSDSKQPAVDVSLKPPPRQEGQDRQQDHRDAPGPLMMRPQLHSRRCHHTYNATRCLPRAVSVRSARARGDPPAAPPAAYEIVLYYDHNRACTIYRTWDDLRRLRSGLGPWRGAPAPCSARDVAAAQRFLCEAVSKKGREVAMEYFLRRRIDDCGGS